MTHTIYFLPAYSQDWRPLDQRDFPETPAEAPYEWFESFAATFGCREWVPSEHRLGSGMWRDPQGCQLALGTSAIETMRAVLADETTEP